jgi:ubiquinol-cytochrome c reductase cytochrome c1 subunit
MKKLLTALLFAPAIALASGAGLHLDKAPDVQGDKAALQSGARTFVNYCLNCHGASYVRYNRLTELGLTEQQVKDNLMFTAVKTGELMRVAARPDEQKQWFGAAPPDLSLIARSRASEEGSGADWLYTYLRSFYRRREASDRLEQHRLRNVGMPHVLWQLQGLQVLNKDHKLELAVPGTLTPAEYDKQVGIWWASWSGLPSRMPVSASISVSAFWPFSSFSSASPTMKKKLLERHQVTRR